MGHRRSRYDLTHEYRRYLGRRCHALAESFPRRYDFSRPIHGRFPIDPCCCMGSPDPQLLAQVVRGDETALSELLAHFGPIVRRELRIEPRWQSLVDADDVMQVTYLEAFLQIRKFQSGSLEGFSAWLRRIAENNLKDAIRDAARGRRHGNHAKGESSGDPYVGLFDYVGGTTTTPSRAASRREIRQVVEDALRALPEPYGRVLRLCELEGKSGNEAAESLGRSHGAVRMLLCRARERLREVLGSGSAFFSDSA